MTPHVSFCSTHKTTAPNHCWSMDFMRDELADGRSFRILTVVDQFTRECVRLELGTDGMVLREGRVGSTPEALAATSKNFRQPASPSKLGRTPDGSVNS
jgi:hypothetical protein